MSKRTDQLSLPFASAKLLDQKAAAEFLGIAPKTLAEWRSQGKRSLAFVRVGRAIRYEPAALLAFIERRRVGPKPPTRAIAVSRESRPALRKTA